MWEPVGPTTAQQALQPSALRGIPACAPAPARVRAGKFARPTARGARATAAGVRVESAGLREPTRASAVGRELRPEERLEALELRPVQPAMAP